MTYLDALDWGARLLAAALAGAVIGFEREIHGKAAGLRTIILISMGSCLFMIASELVGRIPVVAEGAIRYTSDPGRIAAQIVPGVGFIGAGAIIFSGGKFVHGLTTAAVIWMTAAIGMIIGLNYELFGLAVSVMVTLILLLLYWFEAGPLARWFPMSKRASGFDSEHPDDRMAPPHDTPGS